MKSSVVRNRVLVGLISISIAQWSCSAVTSALGSNPTATQTQAVPAASAAPGSCQNSYFPVKNGATWTYSGQFSKEAYTQVLTIASTTSDGFQANMQITDGSGNTLMATIDPWTCTSAGLVELAGPLGATLQSASGSASMKTLSTTGMTIPTQIKSGDTWSQVSQLQFTTADKTYDTTLTYDFTGFGTEQVTVAAGTFNAVKVQVHASTQAVLSGQTVAVTVSGFEWFAPGVGRVKSSETVYAFGIPFASEEGELQSYKIP